MYNYNKNNNNRYAQRPKVSACVERRFNFHVQNKQISPTGESLIFNIMDFLFNYLRRTRTYTYI